ncbi:MAG: hypothetical protein OK422_06570 [Thaumarchaeota archaeon]|nr:hypothetical protein [Nitrososphaerota archaeon]
MVIKTIVHFEIPASDVGRLSRFYTESFGWKFEKVPMPDFDWSAREECERRDVPEDGPGRQATQFHRRRQVDKAIEKFKSAGGREVMGKQEVPGQGWGFIGADPRGTS